VDKLENWPNALLLVIEPILFEIFEIFGRVLKNSRVFPTSAKIDSTAIGNTAPFVLFFEAPHMRWVHHTVVSDASLRLYVLDVSICLYFRKNFTLVRDSTHAL
jgi:hypothetical protein